jgi:origin recognition complex subunit 3
MPTHPTNAILYQLYLESPALINIHDLWVAFFAQLSGEEGEDCEEDVAR